VTVSQHVSMYLAPSLQDVYKQARKAQAKELGLGGEDEEEEEEDEGVRKVDGTSQAVVTAKPGDASVAGATISAEAMAAMAAAASANMPAQMPGNAAAQAHIVAAQAVAARLVAGAASGGVALASSSMPPPPVPTISTAMLQAMQSIPGVTLAPGLVSRIFSNDATIKRYAVLTMLSHLTPIFLLGPWHGPLGSLHAGGSPAGRLDGRSLVWRRSCTQGPL